jgi:hypothetical protein
MAKVPTYDNYLVDQSVNPNVRVNAPLTTEMASIPGQQMQNMGNAMSTAVEGAAKIYADVLTEANKVRVEDAENKLKDKWVDYLYHPETGITNQRGINALERQSGKTLTNEFSDRFQGDIDELDKGLGNSVQRQMFKTKADGMSTLLRANAEKHESQEFLTYSLSVKEGSIKTSMNVIGTNYGNSDLVGIEFENIKKNAGEAGRLNGKSQEWIDANVRDLTSKASKIAILMAVEKDDIVGANNFLTKYKEKMEADDLLQVRNVLNKQVDAGTALNAVDKAFQTYTPQIVTNDSSRAWNLVIGTESRGQQFKNYGKREDGTEKAAGYFGELPITGGKDKGKIATEISVGVQINGKETLIPSLVPTLTKAEKDYLLAGNFPTDAIMEKASAHAKQRIAEGKSPFAENRTPLTSDKGAIGIAQVLPGTAKEMAKELGIPWDEDKYKNDAAYNERLGKAYFDKNLKLFGGNIAQTFAAYNAGTQAVIDYRDGTNVSGKNPHKITTPDGIPPFKETQDYVRKNVAAYEVGKGKNTEPTIMDILHEVRKNLTDTEGYVNPLLLKQASDDAVVRFNRMKASTAQRDDELVGSAIRTLLDNGGNFMALPGGMRANLPADKIEAVMNFGKKIATGMQSTNLAVYQKLTDPQYLATLSEQQFYAMRMELDPGDFKHFAAQRQSLLSGKGMTAAQDIPAGMINQTLNSRFKSLGLDFTPKESDKEAVARAGAANKFVRDAIVDKQMSLGRKLTDVEVEATIDNLFAKSIKFQSTFMGMSHGDMKSQPVLSMTITDVKQFDPKAIDAIKADFARNGVPSPTETDILNVYMRLRMAKK